MIMMIIINLQYFIFSTHPGAFKRKQALENLEVNNCFWKTLSFFFSIKKISETRLYNTQNGQRKGGPPSVWFCIWLP
jgi:hypothetical protein